MRVDFVDHATEALIWACEMSASPLPADWIVLPGPPGATLSCGCWVRVAAGCVQGQDLPCGEHGEATTLAMLNVSGPGVEWLVGRRVLVPGEERAICRCVPADVVEQVNAQSAAEQERLRRLFVTNGRN